VNNGGKIAQCSKVFAVSPSTVRRALDAVTDFDCAKFTLEVNGRELKEILGWLRNGNTSSGELADKIAATIEKQIKEPTC
jgi:hypothetical protein